jgi:hypothetical protein
VNIQVVSTISQRFEPTQSEIDSVRTQFDNSSMCMYMYTNTVSRVLAITRLIVTCGQTNSVRSNICSLQYQSGLLPDF